MTSSSWWSTRITPGRTQHSLYPDLGFPSHTSRGRDPARQGWWRDQQSHHPPLGSSPLPYRTSSSCGGAPTMATATEQMQCSARWWDTSSRRHCYWSDIKNMKNNLIGSVADESFRIVQCLNSHILNSPSQWHSEWVWHHLPLSHTCAGLLLLRLYQH